MTRFFSALAFYLFCMSSLAQSQHVSVVEYHPAPGQFVNVLPEYSEGMTHEQICLQATEALQQEGLVHLGSFGGYVTVKFDHPIQNETGSDIRIMGNSYYAQSDPVYGNETIGGSFEPGIVYVGVGEDVASCRWYELAGSEYYTTEQHDFTITYYKPTAETGAHELPFSSYDQYLRWDATWTDADGVRRDSSGYHMKVASHTQSFWPAWEQEDQLTFTGGRLPNNAIDYSGNGMMWTLYRYAKDAYGYVDASLNTDDYSTFDIDWAVDEDGRQLTYKKIAAITGYPVDEIKKTLNRAKLKITRTHQMKESFSGYYYEKKHRVKKKKIQMLPEESADIMEQQILDTLSHDSTQ